MTLLFVQCANKRKACRGNPPYKFSNSIVPRQCTDVRPPSWTPNNLFLVQPPAAVPRDIDICRFSSTVSWCMTTCPLLSIRATNLLNPQSHILLSCLPLPPLPTREPAVIFLMKQAILVGPHWQFLEENQLTIPGKCKLVGPGIDHNCGAS